MTNYTKYFKDHHICLPLRLPDSLLLPNYHLLLKLFAITILLPIAERIEIVAYATAVMRTVLP